MFLLHELILSNWRKNLLIVTRLHVFSHKLGVRRLPPKGLLFVHKRGWSIGKWARRIGIQTTAVGSNLRLEMAMMWGLYLIQ
jgi:hypothetical protein